MTIALKELHFFGYHGLYAEEKKTGNEFELNLFISFIPVAGIITDLDHTINYASIYELVKKEMEKPRDLLETLIMEIAEHIQAAFPLIKEIDISIAKLRAPISKLTGTVGVSYKRTY